MQSLFLLKRGVILKKIISISLTFFILVHSFYFCFYSTPVYGGLLDVNPDLLEDMANNPEKYEPATMKLTEFLVRTITGGQALDKFFGTSSQELISNIKALFLKEGNCKTDGNNYYLTQNFANEFNQVVQDKVHALDGYYLIEPTASKSVDTYVSFLNSKNANEMSILNNHGKYYEQMKKFIDSASFCFVYPYSTKGYYSIWRCVEFNENDTFLYIGDGYIRSYRKSTNSHSRMIFDGYLTNCYNSSSSSVAYSDFKKVVLLMSAFPFKIFYAYSDLEQYLSKGRTYVPQLPSGGFKVNIKYINNTTNLPDITYNITTENKTETEIQNQYDTTINNYLNGLDDFTDGSGGTTNPTPTPSGGGSGGDFGDGTTPTPKPDFTDGSLTDTNTLLQKILDKLTEFSTNHDKLAKTITDYIEANDGKLDQIIEAINALSDGKIEDEKNGCKYDFTALSDFMTKLWNESDKKFDKMVELLEENNKYQKKLVNSLNEIKAILVTQTIMDVFQDRSQQTAEKAKDKFPTSLPWDIALVVNAMSAEPEKPQFNLPIQIKSLNISEEIHVDLASGEWEKLAKTCRYLLSILFILLMIQLSRKLFSNGGDD